MHIQITNKETCTGCSACAERCPQNCIQMIRDNEGFLYPEVDEDACINCGLCLKTCPITNPVSLSEKKPVAYAGWIGDDQLRKESSSGGVFTALAEKVITEKRGVVFGAVFDKEHRVMHACAESIEELGLLRGSKYTQSVIGETYREAKSFLDEGRTVLFSGTPCQIGGLYSYLGRNYENLYTTDIVCHGVPSPLVWEKYLEYRTNPDRVVKQVCFRNKQSGWKKFSMYVEYEEGKNYCVSFSQDPYMDVFLKNWCLRPSCYHCNYKSTHRQADITLADFWGIERILPEIDDDGGTSLIIVHTRKGRRLLSEINNRVQLRKTMLEAAVKYNSAMIQSPEMPLLRSVFMDRIQSQGFGEAYDRVNRKVGILTFYYKSRNYGGLLQSYALCNYLQKSGYNAEQICYVSKNKPLDEPVQTQPKRRRRYWKIFNPLAVVRYVNKQRAIKEQARENQKWDVRFERIRRFQNQIPHSPQVYYRDTIEESNLRYDCFVAGSDQIWNPAWSDEAYFLAFVEKAKGKIAYAASIGTTEITDEHKRYFKEYLPSFSAVSVREKAAVGTVQQFVSDQKTVAVVDPVLLLSGEEWDKICSKRLVKDKYIFCYFLGEDYESKALAKEYADKHGYKIANIPHLRSYMITESDIGFGDHMIYDASPEDFLSLIKYAECVFTNSFHASVFSGIFQKDFFVFNRKDYAAMYDRILSVCELYNCIDRYCDTADKKGIDYLEKCKSIEYKDNDVRREEAIERSKQFLKENLTTYF